MFEYELKYQKQGKSLIAGIDEAGRGPLAGPVVCACVIMPLDLESIIEGVNDSKKISAKKREMLFEKIVEKAIDYKIVFKDEKVVDEINILNATKEAMRQSVKNLKKKPDVVLIDAVKLDLPFKNESIIKGDAKSYTIACASILAKVTRDNYMVKMAKEYTLYEFERHKGYGTKRHIELLKKHGPCKIHRKTFIKNFVNIK